MLFVKAILAGLNTQMMARTIVQVLLVRISVSDHILIQSGILPKIINPWPNVRYVQEELNILELSIAEVSDWNQYALQGINSRAAHYNALWLFHIIDH